LKGPIIIRHQKPLPLSVFSYPLQSSEEASSIGSDCATRFGRKPSPYTWEHNYLDNSISRCLQSHSVAHRSPCAGKGGNIHQT